MTRKKKSNILNQNIEQENSDIIKNRWENSKYLEGITGNIDESKTKLFEPSLEAVIINENITDLSDLENDDQPQYSILVENNINEEIIEETINEKPKRTLDSLSKTELRFYQRTGIIPN